MSESLQFTIREENGQFCLFTKDGKRKLGCHDTREEAVAQEGAIESTKTAIEKTFDELGLSFDVFTFFDPEDDEGGPSRTFLNALRERLKSMVKDRGSITDDDFNEAIRRARSSAGGKHGSRKRKRSTSDSKKGAGWFDRGDFYEIAASELDGELLRTPNPFLSPMQFARVENGQWIPYLPIPGEYVSPRYGTILITRERNRHFVDNFTNKVYQEKLPVDAEHQTKLSGAMAWIVSMRQNPDGAVDAQVEWTERGKSMMSTDSFKYFSPEFFDEWRDPATGSVIADVAIGGALTTRPFFKEKVLRPLVASEGALDALTNDEEGVTMRAHFERKTQEDSMTDNKGKSLMVRMREALGFTEEQDNEFKTELRKIAATEEDEDAIKAREAEEAKAKEAEAKRLAELEAKKTADDHLKQAREDIVAQDAKIKTLTEGLEKSEKTNLKLLGDARRVRFTEMVEGKSKESTKRWFGETAANISRLEKLADAVGEDSEVFKEIVQRDIASANQVAYGEMLAEKGYGGNTNSPESPEAKVHEDAKKLMSEQPDKFPTIEQARTHVWDMNPDLKRQHHENLHGSRR